MNSKIPSEIRSDVEKEMAQGHWLPMTTLSKMIVEKSKALGVNISDIDVFEYLLTLKAHNLPTVRNAAKMALNAQYGSRNDSSSPLFKALQAKG